MNATARPPAMTDYEAVRAAFRWPRPDRYNFARDAIDRHAARDPDARALLWVGPDGSVVDRSFGEIASLSRRIARLLEEAGVGRGEAMLIVLSRHHAWWTLMTAGLRAGLVLVPGTTQLSAKDIAYRIAASGAVAVATDAANAEKLEHAIEMAGTDAPRARLLVDGARDGWIDMARAAAAMPDDFATVDTAAEEPALCYFTSGTTGMPKMTVHGHVYALAHEPTGRWWLDLAPGDLHWNVSDTGWAKAAWSSYFGPWHMGAAVFVDGAGGFDPKRALSMFARFPVTSLCAAPTVYRMFVQEDLSAFRFPHLRHCVGAGEPLNPEVIETWRRATGLIIRDGYGQTETTLLCGSFPCLPVRPGSMGRPAPGIDLQIIDEEGNVLPPGEEGDIAVRVRPERPPGLFLGYRDDPERTAACFRGDWYLTGDRGLRDEEGFFWFVGRADDVILSSGYRIGPFEVESALLEHPAVVESAVVASPDPTRGEVVKAFVVLAPGFAPDEALVRALQEHVKATTAPYKYPRRIEFVASLPKTVSGKIRRVELRAREWRRRRR